MKKLLKLKLIFALVVVAMHSLFRVVLGSTSEAFARIKQRGTGRFLARAKIADKMSVRPPLHPRRRLVHSMVAVTLVALPLFSALISFSTSTSLRTEADSPSWVSPNDPILTELSQTPHSTYDNSVYSTTDGYFNTDCMPQAYMTDASTWTTSCMVSTAYGDLGPVGYKSELLLTGTTKGGNLTSPFSNYGPQAVPNSEASVQYTSSVAAGVGVAVFTHTRDEITPSVNGFNGSVTYSYNTSPDFYVKDGDGHNLNADATTTAYSQNGEWMVYYSPTANAVIRANLLTRQVLPFASTGGQYNAISNDGQYAALSYLQNSQWYFKVYDLSTCDTNIPATINGPVSCSSKDYQGFLQNSSIPNFHHAFLLRFDTDENLDFWALYDASNSFYLGTAGTYYTAGYRLTEPNVSTTADGYLAMGDSFASGEGAGLAPGETTANFTCPRPSGGQIYGEQCFITGTDETDNNCHLSANSYPYLISRTLNISNFHSVACSGAETKHIIDTNYPPAPQYPNIPQDNSLGSWLPGQIQMNYIQNASPGVITLSVGGNDIGFKDIVMNCSLDFGDCFYFKQDRTALAQRINDWYGEWYKLYRRIKTTSPANTKIYVIGYPSTVAPTGTCGLNTVHLTSNNQVFANKLITYLNYVIKQATIAAGVQYVDIQGSLDGHRLCESETSQSDIAINGYTRGEEILLRNIGSESFHPNELGHRLMEKAVLDETYHFTTPATMPDPQQITPPYITDNDDALTSFLNAPDNGGQTYISMNNDTPQSNSIYFLNNAAQVSASGGSFGLKPSTSYDITLHSDPVDLGTITTDANGDLNGSVTIPSTVAPGFHELDITGPNVAGQTVVVQSIVYVASSTSDYDGDGIPNSSDSCPYVTNSGVDANQNGIDDACDGSQDVAAPTTTASLSPTPDSNGNYNGTVTASLSATATPGFSIANTYYTVDGGSQQIYSAPFTISGLGSHIITYWSIDSAGLTEAMNSKTFTIASNIIAQDTFQRANQTYWGTASDGNVWAGDANNTSVFSISGNTGQVVNTGNTPYSAILGTTATNVEVLVTGKLSSITGLSNIGAVLRFTNGNNWYEAYFNESSLIIEKKVNGKETVISTTSFIPSANTLYSLRFRISGTSLSAKVWQASSQEPANWTATVTDNGLTSAGYTGLRIIAHKAIATITAFTATRF